MYSDEELLLLREEVRARLSEKRFRHTLGVEKMAARLAEYVLPEKKQSLRAAALLHDIAKELPPEEQKDLIKKARIKLTDEELLSVPTLHSYASVYLIKRDFPSFATREILLATKNHTVGSPRMSLFEIIIFLSDYIEEGREYESAVKLREFVLSSLSGNKRQDVRLIKYAAYSSINYTIENLSAQGKYINPKSVLTRNSFSSKI